MAGINYTAILDSLAQGLSAVRDGTGPVSSGQTVHFHTVPTTLSLQVPVLLDGAVDLAFLTKSVRFADAAFPSTDLVSYLQNPATILGGLPVPTLQVPMQGPTLPGAIPPATQVNVNVLPAGPFLPPRVADSAPAVQLPTMTPSAVNPRDVLSGVPGLLGALAGTIPIPALLPVQVSVTWSIHKADGTPAPADSYAQAPGGNASGTDVFFIFFGLVQPLTTTGLAPSTFLVVATVTLTVGTTSVSVSLPAIPVVVPGIPIPTLMLLSNSQSFGVNNVGDDDMARMVMVPADSPIGDLASLTNVINGTVLPVLQQLSFLPTPPAWAPGLLGTLGQLLGLINSYTPVGDRYPLVVVRADRVHDTSSIKFSSSFWGSDDFDDEDESVLFIGVAGQKLSLCTDDDLQGTRMDITTGTEMFVIINDLGTPASFLPAIPAVPLPGYQAPAVTTTGNVKNNLESIGINQ